ncbi:hypothetical protein EDB80DRAFT_102868 [Ilyonectria destructans]|nr:hypothetical protein EDB80DRAFT_102868 [Ilyonectria destructans]
MASQGSRCASVARFGCDLLLTPARRKVHRGGGFASNQSIKQASERASRSANIQEGLAVAGCQTAGTLDPEIDGCPIESAAAPHPSPFKLFAVGLHHVVVDVFNKHTHVSAAAPVPEEARGRMIFSFFSSFLSSFIGENPNVSCSNTDGAGNDKAHGRSSTQRFERDRRDPIHNFISGSSRLCSRAYQSTVISSIVILKEARLVCNN